jgi:transposase-like protein
MLFSHKCPSCLSPNKQELCTYTTKNHGTRKIFQCIDCNCAFSETKGTILENIKHPISKIWKAIDMRTEGMGFNATARSCGISKNTLIDWENKFTPLCKTLYLYSLCHCFMQVVIEGDEFYTKINKNVPADESSGWTIVLMDRASRFIWQMNCGKKDRDLFEKTIKELEEIVNQTNDLSLITDGERRYGNILFEICNELIKTGKPGRPRRTLKKGVKVRVKNKGSQNQALVQFDIIINNSHQFKVLNHLNREKIIQ